MYDKFSLNITLMFNFFIYSRMALIAHCHTCQIQPQINTSVNSIKVLNPSCSLIKSPLLYPATLTCSHTTSALPPPLPAALSSSCYCALPLICLAKHGFKKLGVSAVEQGLTLTASARNWSFQFKPAWHALDVWYSVYMQVWVCVKVFICSGNRIQIYCHWMITILKI